MTQGVEDVGRQQKTRRHPCFLRSMLSLLKLYNQLADYPAAFLFRLFMKGVVSPASPIIRPIIGTQAGDRGEGEEYRCIYDFPFDFYYCPHALHPPVDLGGSRHFTPPAYTEYPNGQPT